MFTASLKDNSDYQIAHRTFLRNELSRELLGATVNDDLHFIEVLPSGPLGLAGVTPVDTLYNINGQNITSGYAQI
jgi:hypothetical protein